MQNRWSYIPTPATEMKFVFVSMIKCFITSYGLFLVSFENFIFNVSFQSIQYFMEKEHKLSQWATELP